MVLSSQAQLARILAHLTAVPLPLRCRLKSEFSDTGGLEVLRTKVSSPHGSNSSRPTSAKEGLSQCC